MRKALLFIVLIALPCMAFAEFQIGPTALYNAIFSPNAAYTTGMYAMSTGLTLSDFTFGADARLKLGLFQACAMGLVSPGVYGWPTEIELYLDLGIAIDIWFIRLGLGAGPNLIVATGSNISSTYVGGNVKLSGDIMFGDVALSLNYLMYLQDFSQNSIRYLMYNLEGNFGVSLLFKL